MSRVVYISILLFIICSALQAQGNSEIMSIDAIQPGMKAKAKTVFEGYQIDEFDLEIIGVLKNYIGTDQHIIVARLLGDKVEFSGVVSGMSGSPVYIDDKLIGALAYRFGIFQKEPIAGITPIGSMLDVQKYSGAVLSHTAFSKDLDSGKLLQEMKPIATPLIFGGIHQSVFGHYAGSFEEMGFLPLQGGGRTDKKSDMGPFEPGAAVAAVLVSGDMDISGTGTLTYRKGNKVLAFGHPLLMSGSVEIPMARAEVLHTLASSYASFKMSNTSEIIGAILQDRLTAVEGEIGKKAGMIPVAVHVKKGKESLKSFHYEIISHKSLSGRLLSLTISNSLANTLFYSENISILAEMQITIENDPLFHLQKLYSDEKRPASIPFFLAADVSRTFSAIFQNRFKEPPIKKIELVLDIREGIQSATLERIWYDKDKVRKGDSVEIKAYFRNYRGEMLEESFQIEIPSGIKQRKLTVILGAPVVVDHLRGKFFQKKVDQARSFKEYLRILGEQPVNHQLVLLLSASSPGAMIEGTLLSNLPPTIASILSSDRGENTAKSINEHILHQVFKPLEFNISGVKTFSIEIE